MPLWNVYNVRIWLSSSVSVLYSETAELSMQRLIICYSRIPTIYISKSSYYGRKRRYPQNDTRKVWKVIRSHKSRTVKTIQWPKVNGQKDKHWFTKHYTENSRLSNTNRTKTRGWTQVFSKGKLFYLWCESNVKWRFLKIQKHRYNIQSQLIKVCTNTKNLTFSVFYATYTIYTSVSHSKCKEHET